jgi:hypothetical protein
MSDDAPQLDVDEPGSETVAGRRRAHARVADVFGDVLPLTTRDERALTLSESGDGRDEELLADVPPHHR